jgi:hypothetical protein
MFELAGAFSSLHRARTATDDAARTCALADVRHRIALVTRAEAPRPSIADLSDDVRTGIRVLHAHLRSMLAGLPSLAVLLVTTGVARFRAASGGKVGDAVDLGTRRAARLVLAAPVEELERRPQRLLRQGDPTVSHDLVRAGPTHPGRRPRAHRLRRVRWLDAHAAALIR